MSTSMTVAVVGLVLLRLGIVPEGIAQTARSSDVESPESIVAAAYASLQRPPGEHVDWDRFRSLFLPGANMVPNAEQTEGEFRIMKVEDFIDWIDAWNAETAPIGGPDDRGFSEEQIALEIERFGDVAVAMSTYERKYWEGEEVLARGINAYQLVRADGRWWIVGIVWDEESGAGPIPSRYMAAGR